MYMGITFKRAVYAMIGAHLILMLTALFMCNVVVNPWIISSIIIILSAVSIYYFHKENTINSFIIMFFTSYGMMAVCTTCFPSGNLVLLLPAITLFTGVVRDQDKQYFYLSKNHTAIMLGLITVFYVLKILNLGIVTSCPIFLDIALFVMLMSEFVYFVGCINKKSRIIGRKYSEQKQIANTDALTGLPNRHNLESHINKLSTQIHTFSVIMMDIDNFKRVNDTYGHVFGDTVLKELGSILKSTIRENRGDVAYRYGGEEFCVVCEKTNAIEASVLADRIRENFKDKKYKIKGFPGEQSFTISLGVAECAYKQFKDCKTLIGLADRALYDSKHSGKDKVTIYQDVNTDLDYLYHELN